MIIIPTQFHNFYFSPRIEPCLYCDSGETITFEVLDCYSNALIQEGSVLGKDNPKQSNPMTGPLFVNKAKPGDAIKIEILNIEIGSVGVSVLSDDNEVFKNCNSTSKLKRFSVIDGVVNLTNGIYQNAEPMVGVIGLAPNCDRMPSGMPGSHGGNLDCRLIQAGSVLYLPVAIEGGLLSIGDLHAIMGDGELGECGLEISGAVTIRVTLISRQLSPNPLLLFKDKIVAIASDEDIYKAVNAVTHDMLNLLVSELSMEGEMASHIINLCGNIGICQICNQLKTVRMELQLDELKRAIECIQ